MVAQGHRGNCPTRYDGTKRMTWTNHGHHIPSTSMDSSDRPPVVARCGGPLMCGQCARESGMYHGKHPSTQTIPLVVYSSGGLRTIIGTAEFDERTGTISATVDPDHDHLLKDSSLVESLSLEVSATPTLPFTKGSY